MADEHYRRAIALYRDHAAGVREEVQAGQAIAPVDPAHYLTFARLCIEHGNSLRAVDFYRKYLAQVPAPADAASVRGELAALSSSADPFPTMFSGGNATVTNTWGKASWPWLALATALIGLWSMLYLRRRERRLARLLLEHPEWHQTAAYHLGCLRHELFKHRIGPLGDPLRAVARRQASPEEIQFLRDRMTKDAPLLLAWRGHLAALERSLGILWRLDTWDPLFRRARRALRKLRATRWPLNAITAERILVGHSSLMAFENTIADMLTGLARCQVDEAFLRDIVQSTRAEWTLAQLQIDDLRIGPVPADVEVDVLPTDLNIVLRNLARNAMQAIAKSDPPRRLALDVLVELQITGEECVVFRIRDSSSDGLTGSDWRRADMGRGLGLVDAALRRYDGSLQVLPGTDGFAKAVLVRFFHSQRRSRDAEAS